MRNLLSGVTAIPLVELGTLNGFAETVEFQATMKNLMTYETKLAKAGTIGYRFRPDFRNRKIIFETYKGIDRTTAQDINSLKMDIAVNHLVGFQGVLQDF